MNLKFVLLRRKKILMLHFRGRGYQFAVLDTFGRDQLAGNLVDFVAPPADNYHFQTVMFVQMNV